MNNIHESNFKSQFGQDKYVINNIYPGLTNGYFIEVGAYDGIESSNTYALEKNYNWDGICVECNPSFYPNIQKIRTCKLSTDAVWNKDNETLTFIDETGYSGIEITNKHNLPNSRRITVKTKKLSTILKEYSAPSFIHYLSIDTEGSEFEILNSHNFSEYIFGFITVEHNFIEENRNNIRRLLESKGYKFVRENNVDDDYVLINLREYL